MTYEITKVELFGENRDGDQVSYTCASGTAIPKGTLLTLSDPRTVAANTASGAAIAGIAAMDKSGTDFSTKISVWTNGIFEGYASRAITAGDRIQGSTNNWLGFNVPGSSGAATVGYSLKTAADGEKFTFKLTH
ncbi:DUF2190 family protein [Candidatus Dojkabacteria bacterium]|jgi:hypothetical protein|nr:DUF2190 family protein [Candidatus Dojkabacteria bacterium]